jgi:hypothetical protein
MIEHDVIMLHDLNEVEAKTDIQASAHCSL